MKLQNERAARDLWDVLEDFPPQAVLLNTHLLHCVLDLVGAPFSQADVGKLPILIVHKEDVPNIILCSFCLIIFIFRRGSPGPALSQRLEVAGNTTAEVHSCLLCAAGWLPVHTFTLQ